MKIIDLLNKIANGEEPPKKIKFENFIYIWRNIQKDYFCEKINHSLESIIGEYLFGNLNLEVGIIEEDKEIEKLNKDRYAGTDLDITADMFDKINELIDKVNSLENKE